MMDDTPSFGDRFKVFIVEPMSLFWLLIPIVLIAGVVLTIRTGDIAWEAFYSAGMLILLVHFLAGRRGVHAWPWSGREDDES